MATESLTEETDGSKSFDWSVVGLFVVAASVLVALEYTLEVAVWGQLVVTAALVTVEERKATSAGELTK